MESGSDHQTSALHQHDRGRGFVVRGHRRLPYGRLRHIGASTAMDGDNSTVTSTSDDDTATVPRAADVTIHSGRKRHLEHIEQNTVTSHERVHTGKSNYFVNML